MSSIVDIRPALRARLLADTAVAAIVDQRIYAGQMPQGETRASLVYQMISSVADHHLQGPSGLAMQRYQIDAWSKDLDEAERLARAAQASLDGYSGAMPWGSNSPQDSVTVRGIFLTGGHEAYEDDTKLHGRGRDYAVHFAER